jgi:uncharacterized membrane protein
MSDLIVVSFDGTLKAEQVRLDLLKMESEHLIDLEEAAVVVHTKEGKVRLHHAEHLTFPGALGGGFLGVLVGLMVFNPAVALVSMVSGAALGAVAGAASDVGIDEAFMQKLGDHLKPGSSALFILARKGQPDKIIEELSKFQGKVLRTSLAHQDAVRLRAVLDKIKRQTS